MRKQAALRIVPLALGLAAAPVSAQTNALVLFVSGSRVASLVDLSTNGDDFSGAFALGGGVGLQVGGATALRASFTRGSTTYRGPTLGAADPDMRRTYVGADVQAGWPGTSGFVPYVFVGGGAVHTDPSGSAQPAVTSPAARLGLGFNWLSRPGVVFAEAAVWGYRFEGLGFSRAQLDAFITAGLAVPFVF